MSKYEELERRWDSMTEDEQCLAYGKALLSDAAHRDSIFRKEGNAASVRYEMRTKFIYGEGSRE